jgi:hypothetical protein
MLTLLPFTVIEGPVLAMAGASPAAASTAATAQSKTNAMRLPLRRRRLNGRGKRAAASTRAGRELRIVSPVNSGMVGAAE